MWTQQQWQQEQLRQAERQLRKMKALQAQAMVAQANKTMGDLVNSSIRQGLARTVDEATRLVIQRYGAGMVKQLEDNLRAMGAQGVRVTCP